MSPMRLSIATKVFLGFVAVLACSAAVSGYGIIRLQRIGRGRSLRSRPSMPRTRPVSPLEPVLQDQMRQGVEEAEREERAARWALLGLSVIALAVGLLMLWLSQRTLAPIRTLTEAAQRLGRGSPESVAVPEHGGDELALLAHEFNAMAQRLAARERELRAQGEALLRSDRLAAIGRIPAPITHEIRNPPSP